MIEAELLGIGWTPPEEEVVELLTGHGTPVVCEGQPGRQEQPFHVGRARGRRQVVRGADRLDFFKIYKIYRNHLSRSCSSFGSLRHRSCGTSPWERRGSIFV